MRIRAQCSFNLEPVPGGSPGDPALRLDFKPEQGTVEVRLLAIVSVEVEGFAHVGVYQFRAEGVSVVPTADASS